MLNIEIIDFEQGQRVIDEMRVTRVFKDPRDNEGDPAGLVHAGDHDTYGSIALIPRGERFWLISDGVRFLEDGSAPTKEPEFITE